MGKLNTVIIGDTQYVLNKAYRSGALAMRAGHSYSTANPYGDNSQSHLDWNEGHCNESAGYHDAFGIDVITASPGGNCFREKP